MPLHVIYVEDSKLEGDGLLKVINKVNEGLPEWSKIYMTLVTHPSKLPQALKNVPDVVLADVWFRSLVTTGETDQLDDIIGHVRDWDKKSDFGFPTPVIAYTGRGPNTLTKCLERRGELYDIWDKMSASAPYVAWRFQNLVKELSRHRPDATIQKLISGMTREIPLDADWHNVILKLVRAYSERQTEFEQIEECSKYISVLVDKAIPYHWKSFASMWNSTRESEYLLRSASPTLRGVVRHSINVYWLGYWLINNGVLQDFIIKNWQEMINHRDCPTEVRAADALTMLNRIWFFAGIFHDAGKFPENSENVINKYNEFVDAFDDLGMMKATWNYGDTEGFNKFVESALSYITKDLEKPLVIALQSSINGNLKAKKLDHGVIAAVKLILIANKISDIQMQFCVREAAKAILLHSCMPSVIQEDGSLALSWKKDPIASLLLFCDQIQTWDRHSISKQNQGSSPERAELSWLKIDYDGKGRTKPLLTGCINYIVPSRVEVYPGLRRLIAEELDEVLKNKPKNALLHAIKPNEWPFQVSLSCALSGELLETRLDFT